MIQKMKEQSIELQKMMSEDEKRKK